MPPYRVFWSEFILAFSSSLGGEFFFLPLVFVNMKKKIKNRSRRLATKNFTCYRCASFFRALFVRLFRASCVLLFRVSFVNVLLHVSIFLFRSLTALWGGGLCSDRSTLLLYLCALVLT